MMEFVYNDGGRRVSGRKGSAGDCVCRSIAIASGMPYEVIYAALAQGCETQRNTTGTRRMGRTARNGICTSRNWFKRFMVSLGLVWTPTMRIGSGCRVHLTAGELPGGALVVAVSKHYTAVINGVIHDTFDPQRNIAMFRQFPGWQTAELKPGENRNNNGIWTVSRRCVYGYWELKGAPK